MTAAIIGPEDVLKVIDQGADDTTNAVSIRRFFALTSQVKTTEKTREATIIQTRHRIPETPLRAGQTIVYQVPIPEPLRFLEPRETETLKMHALAEYGAMYVKLYEDITNHGKIATSYNYPVMVHKRYLMSPSPIPKFDNPKMDGMPALQLFGAGREKRIYAVPPYTLVKSLDFEDHPFRAERGGRSAPSAAPGKAIWMRSSPTTGEPDSTFARIRTTAGSRLSEKMNGRHQPQRAQRSQRYKNDRRTTLQESGTKFAWLKDPKGILIFW